MKKKELKKVREFIVGVVALGLLIPALLGVAKYCVVCFKFYF